MQPVDPRPEVSLRVRSLFEGRRVSVLDAGAGSLTHLDVPQDWPVTGLDILAEPLEENTRLSEGIVGDLQTVRLPRRFDLVICYNVLEHLEHPAVAVRNLAEAVRPGGVLVLAVPLATGFQGYVTRVTPHWFHVAFYHYVLGRKTAGLAGHAPVPTLIREEMRPERLTAQLKDLGFRERYARRYASTHYWGILRNHHVFSLAARAAAAVIAGLSAGTITRLHSDFIGLYQRQPEATVDAAEPEHLRATGLSALVKRN
jgi:2-polyprenyl-3-methyl-5-hydroxy-6-metoxy-1,4-benzoquinol methylase